MVSFGFFWSTVKESTDRIRRSSFQELVSHTQFALKSMTNVATTASDILRQGYFNISEETDAFRFSWSVYQANVLTRSNDIVSSSYIGLANGAIAGFSRASNDLDIDRWSSYEDPYQLWYGKVNNFETGDINSTSVYYISLSKIDWEEGVWYTTSRDNNGSTWSSSYTNAAFPGFMWISFVTPFRDSYTNEFLGYFGCDCTTDSVGRFLYMRSQLFLQNTIIMVERKTGYLVASSHPNEKLYLEHPGGVVERRNGSTSGDLLLKSTVLGAWSIYGYSWEKLGSRPEFNEIRINGRRFILNVQTITDEYGIDWVLFESMPITNFTRKFNQSIGVLVGVAVFFLIVGTFISVVSAGALMKPLSNLIQQAIKIENMELEDVQQSLVSYPSYFSEVRRLQQSYYSMTKRLIQFRSFIPDHILVMIEQENREMKELKAIMENHGRDEEVKSIMSSSIRSNSKKQATESSQAMKSSSKGRKDSYNQGSASSAFYLGLSQSFVTVLSVNMDSYVKILEEHSPASLTKVTSDFMTAFHNIVRVTNGQFVKANCDHIVVVWNAQIIQDDHMAKACRTAHNCQQKLKMLRQQWTQKNLPLLGVKIGIACGQAYFGNLGYDKMKYFSVIGSVVNEAEGLAKSNEEWGTNILCQGKIVERIDTVYQTRPIFHIDSVESDDSAVFEIGDPIESKQDEWMYELQEQEKSSRWQSYTLAYGLYRVKEYAKALEILNVYLSGNEEDIVARKLFDECKKHIG